MNLNDIRKLEPCYDPAKYLPEDWEGTAVDILRVKDCPQEDRLWVVCREGWIDGRTMRLFAVWCARQSLKLVDNPDPRSIAACDVAERYANGEATKEELDAARDAALDATCTAACTAAWSAAWAAAWDGARAAAWDGARASAWTAARVSARASARAAARDAQIAHLIEMLESK
jgi:hypothetical protein